MGDSDDDYDRRRRDKFQRERPSDSGRERRRDNWDDRRRSDGNWNRRGRDSYGDRRRDRYSPSPPQKRMRRDWDDRGNYGDMSYGGAPSGYGGGWGGHDLRGYIGQQHGYGVTANRGGPEPDYPTQPPVIPFKQFLVTQDDSISEEEAVKRYNQYKQDFKKTQINEFFLAHKDEEWFKMKYHPEESAKRKAELGQNLKIRRDAFMKLHSLGRITETQLETENSATVTKLLDAAVILMEGGTEDDLQVLDNLKDLDDQESSGKSGGKANDDADASEATKNGTDQQGPESPVPEKKKKKRRQKKRDYNDSESGSSHSDSGSSSSSSSSSSDSDSDREDHGTSKTKALSPKEKQLTESQEKSDNGDDTLAKALHRTQSIFIRNLAPNITKQEVEMLCNKYPGFLRVALQDPQAERKFFRRGWVTFDRNVNIKDICWNLSNIRLRDCELGAIVNRDLKQRVRPVSGLVNHKQAIKTYIKLAAKVIQNMDDHWKIWQNDDTEKRDGEKGDQEKAFGLVSKNPVLKGITDYLVDEASFDDELLGEENDKKDVNAEITIEKDPDMTRKLDCMIWYLRIVYSLDFYNGIEYPNEHEMPHRCGIVHGRGPIPGKLPTQTEMNDFIGHFEQKVKQFTDDNRKIDEAECVLLGKKDPESEVEKFITANTQELSKDKWLCPLSGKKFKGPEFVRKHIISKHGEKVEEVKTEAMYFNNYLEDAKRPALPEHPANNLKASSGGKQKMYSGDMAPPQGGGYFGSGVMQQPYSRGSYGYGDPYGGGGGYGRHDNYSHDLRRGSPRFGSGSNRRDGRRLIQYNDLDAPDDSDLF